MSRGQSMNGGYSGKIIILPENCWLTIEQIIAIDLKLLPSQFSFMFVDKATDEAIDQLVVIVANLFS